MFSRVGESLLAHENEPCSIVMGLAAELGDNLLIINLWLIDYLFIIAVN